MISKKETQEKVRNSVYWAPDTKLLVQRKSEELQLSQNRLTEICLQEDAQKLSSFLRLEKGYKSNIFDKKYFFKMHDLLILMLRNAERKKQLNNDELFA